MRKPTCILCHAIAAGSESLLDTVPCVRCTCVGAEHDSEHPHATEDCEGYAAPTDVSGAVRVQLARKAASQWP